MVFPRICWQNSWGVKKTAITNVYQESPIMMDQSEKDAGTIAALMLRFTKFRLPRAKRLLKKVNSGETLSAGDIAFLKRVREDNQSNIQLVKRNPTYQGLVTGFMELYTEIITKGLENEKTQKAR